MLIWNLLFLIMGSSIRIKNCPFVYFLFGNLRESSIFRYQRIGGTHLVFNGSISHLLFSILSQVAASNARLAWLFLSSILVDHRVQWVIFKAHFSEGSITIADPFLKGGDFWNEKKSIQYHCLSKKMLSEILLKEVLSSRLLWWICRDSQMTTETLLWSMD